MAYAASRAGPHIRRCERASSGPRTPAGSVRRQFARLVSFASDFARESLVVENADAVETGARRLDRPLGLRRPGSPLAKPAQAGKLAPHGAQQAFAALNSPPHIDVCEVGRRCRA